MAAILANLRYTGRQVWNRQRTDFDLADPANTGFGHKQVQRWNLPEGWVISRHPAHAALVSEAEFIAAQKSTAPRGPAGGAPLPASRAARLRAVRAAAGIGLVQRQARLPVPPRPCNASSPDSRRPRNTYVREDQILPHLAAISVLLAGVAGKPGRGISGAAQVTGPADTAGLIDQLRADGAVLAYDPDDRTLRADRQDAPSVTIGEDH